MAMYIIQGNFTLDAMRGLMAKPSDRAAAVKHLVEGAGGKMLSYYITTGPFDFQLTVETDDTEGLMAALMVAGAAGGVSNMQTIQAFSSPEFMAAQTRAGKMAAGYQAPNA